MDLCCFNRPFDDQSQLRIRLETEAKLYIQESIIKGAHELVWSYMIDYENEKNPFPEKQKQILRWRTHSTINILENDEILNTARTLKKTGLKAMDALHLSCAISAKATCFITTDDGILRKANRISGILLTDPIEFIRKIAP